MAEEAQPTNSTSQSEIDGSAIKSLYQSKIFWVNVISIIALLVQQKFGFVVSEDVQVQALAVVNIVLRTVTHQPVKWK